MTLLHLSVILLVVTSNGPNVGSASSSNDGEAVSDLIAKLEARLEAKDKERYEELLKTIFELSADTEINDGEMKERLDKIDLGLMERQDNIEAQLVAKVKEEKQRYGTLLGKMFELTIDRDNYNSEMRQNMNKTELEFKKRYDHIVARLDKQDRYTQESRMICECETARSYSSYQYQADYIKLRTCLANPYLIDNAFTKWIVFQRRVSGHVSFNRNWTDYKTGFGSSDDGDFWLGLEPLHEITNSGTYELEVVLTYNGRTEHAQYSWVKIRAERYGYRLRLGKYVGGGAGDSLTYHKNVKFSTKDKDNDNSHKNCAKNHLSGWWFHGCVRANLNGLWGVNEDGRGLVWDSFTGKKTASFSEMKIRRKN